MPQLDMFSWLNQVLTTTVVMFFFYALLCLVFLPHISTLLRYCCNKDKGHLSYNMLNTPVNSCLLFICNVSINPVSGTFVVRKASSRVERLQARLNQVQIDSNTLLQQDYTEAHGWKLNVADWVRLENSFCDHLSTVRNTVPPVSQDVLHTLNRHMMNCSIRGRTAEGYATLSEVKLQMTAHKVKTDLATAQQALESAESHLELLTHLSQMNIIERVVYSISRSPTTMKILNYSVELLYYHFAQYPLPLSYM